MARAKQLEYRPASIDEIYRLRFAVLRPKLTPERVYFPGDDGMPTATWHFGAFQEMETSGGRAATGTDPCVACLTLLASTWQGAAAMQLRGMAVAAACRGKGVGARLLRTAVETLLRSPGVPALWWCNARVEAIGFYERMGWQVVSEEFMIEGVGMHKKMVYVAA